MKIEEFKALTIFEQSVILVLERVAKALEDLKNDD